METLRIFQARQILIAALLLFLLNAGFFLHEQINNTGINGLQTEKEIIEDNIDASSVKGLSALRAELEELSQNRSFIQQNDGTNAYFYLLDQITHIMEYRNIYENIKSNATSMLLTAKFSEEGSFAKKNIDKTVKDYGNINPISTALVNTRSIAAWSDFSFTDILILILFVLIVLGLLEERKNGMWGIVRLASEGRLWIQAERMLILVFFSFLTTVLFQGSTMMLSFLLYGAPHNFSITIQSSAEFTNLTIPMSIGGYIVLYLFLKFLGYLAIGTFIWFVLSKIREIKFSIVLIAGVFGISYSAYRFIPANNSFVLFKYLNFFSVLDAGNYLRNYKNLNLFGQPVGLLPFTIAVLILLFIMSGTLAIQTNARAYPVQEKSRLAKWSDNIARKTSPLLESGGLFRMECYKIFHVQKGFLLLLLLLLYQFNQINIDSVLYSSDMEYANYYYKEFGGGLTEEKLEDMAELSSQLESDIEAAENDNLKSQLEYKLAGLSMVMEEADRISKLDNADVELVNPVGFSKLIGNETKNEQELHILTALLFIILILSGSIAYEKQTGMNILQHAAKRGSAPVLIRKLFISVLVSFLASILVFSVEIYNIAQTYPTASWNANIASLAFFDGFPFSISILGAAILIYLCKLCLICIAGLLIVGFSAFFGSTAKAIIASCFIFLLPSALYLIGIKQMEVFALVRYINVTNLL